MYYVTILNHFSPWFSIQLTPFFIGLRFFQPLIFPKPLNRRSEWVHLITCADNHYQTFGEVPPPPPLGNPARSIKISIGHDQSSPTQCIDLPIVPGPGVGTPILRHGRKFPRWWQFNSDLTCSLYFLGGGGHFTNISEWGSSTLRTNRLNQIYGLVKISVNIFTTN